MAEAADELARSLLRLAATGDLPAREALQGVDALERAAARAPEPVSRSRVHALLAGRSEPELDAIRRSLARRLLRDASDFHWALRQGQAGQTPLRAALAALPLDPAPALGWRELEAAVAELRGALAALDRDATRGAGASLPACAATGALSLDFLLDALADDPSEMRALAGAEGDAPLDEARTRLAAARERLLDAERRRLEAWVAGVAAGRLAPPSGIGDDAAVGALASRLLSAQGPERAPFLDALACFRSDAAAHALAQGCATPSEQERAGLILTMRMGSRALDWDGWRRWLAEQSARHAAAAQALDGLTGARPRALLALWCASHESDAADLARWFAGAPGAAAAAPVITVVAAPPETPADAPAATGAGGPPPPPAPGSKPPPTPVITLVAPGTERRRRAKPVAPARPPVARVVAAPEPPPPPPPREEPLWQTHLERFVSENWFLAVGLLMVVAGASLLAYYTWDKSWALRYSLMPAMLGAFTGGLAGLGGWLERKDGRLAGTAALLRGAAIGLLPVNFVAIALLAGDPEVPAKGLLVPGMAAVYLILAGAGLARWCGAVHESLRRTLVPALLAVNALVVLAPIASVLSPLDARAAALVIAVGFHLGFGVVVYAVLGFGRTALDGRMAADTRVPAFFGATLLLTFVETFFWAHALLRELPAPAAYALLTVAAGGAVFTLERRFLELRGTPEAHAEVSFLGFALVLLGVLLGLGHAPMRTLCLVAAGAVWLHQAWARRHPAHYGAALLFFFLAGPSIAFAEGFPAAHAPLVAIALAAALEALARLGREDATRASYRAACKGFETAALLLGALAAPVMQLGGGGPPLVAALYLLAIAGLFVRRALQDGSPRWLLTALALAAFSLPWLGCVDMAAPSLAGNRMALGLAALAAAWLAAAHLARRELLARARSTAVVLYGAVALLLLALEWLAGAGTAGGLAGAPLAERLANPAGALAVAGFVALAGWWTRSWLPMLLALGILALDGPVLAGLVKEALGITTSHGVGRAVTSLAALLIAFRLRGLEALRALGDPEPWLGGDRPLPLVRRDATLFTGPLLLASCALAAAADWKALAALLSGEPAPLFALAAAVTSVTWTLLSVYAPRSWAGVRLGWAAGLLALAHLAGPIDGAALWWLAGASLLAAQAALVLYRYALQPRIGRAVAAALVAPQARLVSTLAPMLAVLAGVALLLGAPPSELRLLLPLALGEEVLAALATPRRKGHGAVALCLALAIVAAVSSREAVPLLDLARLGPSSVAVAALLLAIEAAHLLLEAAPHVRAGVAGLLAPVHAGSALAAAAGAVVALGYAWIGSQVGGATGEPTLLAAALRVAVVLAVARAQRSGPMLAAGLLLAYAEAHAPGAGLLAASDLLAPSHLALLAIGLAVAGEAGRRLQALGPRLLEGGFAVPLLRAPARPLLYPAAAIAAFAATLGAAASATLRVEAAGLWIPFAASGALALVAWSWRSVAFHHMAAGLLAVANVLVVRALLRDHAGDLGLSGAHLLAIGLGATLLEGTLLAAALRDDLLRRGARRQALALALLVVIVLVTHYFAHPDLGAVTTARFAVSGAMSYLAGLYFRRAARAPVDDEARAARWLEALWHLSLTMALFCAALLLPALRTPVTAPIAIGAPLLYFYARAEMDRGSRYLDSATVLAFTLLGLHAFRGAVQAIVFPEAEIGWRAYHLTAPATLVLALIMLRLRGLGGTGWLAVYGGFAGMAAVFLTASAPEALSPFASADRAALVGAGLAHFLLALGAWPSPVRAGLMAILGAGEAEWRRLARTWGAFLVVAAHGLAFLGAAEAAGARPLLAAPVLLAVASVSLHASLLLRSAPLFLLGLLEALCAVHAGFLLESWLPARHAVWAVLAIWAAFVAAGRRVREAFGLERLGVVTFNLFLAAAAHVWVLHPSSPEGLLAAGAIAALGAASPSERSVLAQGDEDGVAGLLLLAPAWLAYFSQAPLAARGWDAALLPWPVLCATAALLGTGLLAERVAALALHAPPFLEGTIADQACSLLRRRGDALHRTTLWLALLLAGGLRLASDERWGGAALALDAGILLAVAGGMVRHGLSAAATVSYAAAELALVALFAAVREEWMLARPGAWTYATDVWAEVLAALGLAALKELVRVPREGALPITASLLVMPALAIWTAVAHGAHPDVLLLVIGVHAVLYAFFGRHERTSPFNAAAVLGFTAFAIVAVRGRLEWNTLHAYVVPAGMGVLALVHIFGGRIEAGVKSNIRALALTAMLASCGYYVLLDRMNPRFQAVFLGVSVLAAAAGSLLRVRLYLFLGVAAIAVDLGAVVSGVVMSLDRSARMTSVGVLVLLVGVAFVGGAAYYKANEEALLERIAGWRRRLAAWE